VRRQGGWIRHGQSGDRATKGRRDHAMASSGSAMMQARPYDERLQTIALYLGARTARRRPTGRLREQLEVELETTRAFSQSPISYSQSPNLQSPNLPISPNLQLSPIPPTQRKTHATNPHLHRRRNPQRRQLNTLASNQTNSTTWPASQPRLCPVSALSTNTVATSACSQLRQLISDLWRAQQQLAHAALYGAWSTSPGSGQGPPSTSTSPASAWSKASLHRAPPRQQR
jgi:hypothetical protein